MRASSWPTPASTSCFINCLLILENSFWRMIMIYNFKATTDLQKPHRHNRDFGYIRRWVLLLSGVLFGGGGVSSRMGEWVFSQWGRCG